MFFITRYDKIYNYKIKLHNTKPGAFKFGDLLLVLTQNTLKKSDFYIIIMYRYYHNNT